MGDDSLDKKLKGNGGHGGAHQHLGIDSFWRSQTEFFDDIQNAGGFASHVQFLPNLVNSFEADRILKCIDEGTGNGIRSAGSGIVYVKTKGLDHGLLGYPAIEAGLIAAARAFAPAELEGAYSHEECGAAKLIYGLLSGDFRKQLGADHQISSFDEFGDYFARRLAEKLSKDYKGRIGIKEMSRPSGSHVTRFTYVDAAGNFDPALGGLPQGFVVSRKYLGYEQTLLEASVSIDIATGDHGFGNRITSKQPHILVVVGDSSDKNLSKESIIKELEPLAAKYNGKVIVDGFTAPIK